MSQFLLALLFSVTSFSTAHASVQRKLYCVSWMNLQIEIHSVPLSEYETAFIHFGSQDWAFEADVLEGKLNYLKLFHIPSGMETQASSLVYPMNQLYVSMENKQQKATVDCDLRPL